MKLRGTLALSASILALAPDAGALTYTIDAKANTPYTPRDPATATEVGNPATQYDRQGTVDLPFRFPFYGKERSRIFISSFGYVQVIPPNAEANTEDNTVWPSTVGPGNIIAPWWDWINFMTLDNPDCDDDILAGHLIHYTEGETGSRRFVVEWQRFRQFANAFCYAWLYNMKLTLHEGTGAFEIHYGPREQGLAPTPNQPFTASVGFENDAENEGGNIGGAQLGCAQPDTCTENNLFDNINMKILVHAHDANPNLVPQTFTVDAFTDNFSKILLGYTFANRGTAANNVSLAFYASDNATKEAGDSEFGRDDGVNFALNATYNGTKTVNLPTQPFLLAVADANATVAEWNEDDNVLAIPMPPIDLAAVAVAVDRPGAPRGATIEVERQIHNGSGAAADVPYTVLISADQTPDASDFILLEGSVIVAAGVDDTASDSVVLQEGTPLGAGHLILVLDPDGVAAEQDESNNVRTVPFEVHPAGTVLPLAVTTDSLPRSKVGEAYEVQLRATGGEVTYQWSVAAGGLPTGITLSTSGLLSGVPSLAGDFNFAARVQSGSATDDQSLVLGIDQVEGGVTIFTAELPAGKVGKAYNAQLLAEGGDGAYEWTLNSGALPEGLSLSPAGIIDGTPTEAGDFTVRIAVASAGAAAEKGFTIAIAGLPMDDGDDDGGSDPALANRAADGGCGCGQGAEGFAGMALVALAAWRRRHR